MTMFLKLTGSYIEAEVTSIDMYIWILLNSVKMSSRQNFLSLRLNFVVSMIENTQILFLESKGELEKKQKTIF